MTPKLGGKIPRTRRLCASPTPYDRPPSSDSGTPNWLSSSARKLAQGARRVMRSVLWSNSSSSDCSSDEVNTNGCCLDISSLEGNKENEKLYPGLLEWRSVTKRAIVMLLMQETFSREECHRLIDIVNSRQFNTSDLEDIKEKKHGGAIGPDAPSTDTCCVAVMEARKWINESKLRLNSKSVSPSSVTSCSYSCGSSPYNMTKLGSPVDIARSYMCGRPLSPMESIAAYRTPQSKRMLSVQEETPGLIRGKSFSCAEDLVAAVACDAEGSQSIVIQPPQKGVIEEAKHIIISRRSLTMELDSQAESIQFRQKQVNSASGGHGKANNSMSNDNEVGLCKFVSESSVEIPINDICM